MEVLGAVEMLAGMGATTAPTALDPWVGWGLSLVIGGLWVAGLVSLLRGPLDERRRLPWALAMVMLPGLGALVWFWWRHRHYPRRLAAEPGWDPNRRTPVALPPRRTGASGRPTTTGREDPYAHMEPHPDRLPTRRL